MNVELFQGRDGWRWRLKAGNGEILATSEAYDSKSNAERSAQLVTDALHHGVPADVITDALGTPLDD